MGMHRSVTSTADVLATSISPAPFRNGVRRVPHLGSMAFTLPVSLERMYENALDWEHLPWVHASTFSSIEVVDDGPWGWLADVTSTSTGARSRIELRLERDLRRWITETHEGPGTGGEIWTNVAGVDDDEIHLVIDFFAPAHDEADAAVRLDRYASVYQQLYREDLAMMLDRQAGLDGRGSAGDPADTVTVALTSAGEFPDGVDAFGTTWRVAMTDEGPIAHAARCTHRLGSLADAEVTDGVITCPWHGYRFDVSTGDCVSGQRCRLPVPPQLELTADTVTLRRR